MFHKIPPHRIILLILVCTNTGYPVTKETPNNINTNGINIVSGFFCLVCTNIRWQLSIILIEEKGYLMERRISLLIFFLKYVLNICSHTNIPISIILIEEEGYLMECLISLIFCLNISSHTS